VIAAVGIVAPAHRLSDEHLEKGVISMVQEAGKALSTKLGFLSAAGKK
jgi:DNA-binding IclR family transcriptional regulator